MSHEAVDGAKFVLDAPAEAPAVWGEAEHVLWPEGESLMLAAPQGVAMREQAE